MSRAVKIILSVLAALLLVGLVAVLVLVLLFSPVRASKPQPGGEASLPNPTAVYCEGHGGSLEVRSSGPHPADDGPLPDLHLAIGRVQFCDSHEEWEKG